MAEPRRERQEAIALGLKRYFTGEPCRSGHTAERYVLTRQCVICTQARKDKWEEENPGRDKALKAAHYREHSDLYKLRARINAKSRPKRPRKPRTEEQQHREREAERARRAADPEPSRANARNRRSARKKAGGKHTAQDIAAIYAMQKGKCAYCRVKLTSGLREVDHIVPIKLGGTNDRSNLQVLCRPCNRSKRARDPISYAQSKGMLL